MENHPIFVLLKPHYFPKIERIVSVYLFFYKKGVVSRDYNLFHVCMLQVGHQHVRCLELAALLVSCHWSYVHLPYIHGTRIYILGALFVIGAFHIDARSRVLYLSHAHALYSNLSRKKATFTFHTKLRS